MTTPCKDCGRPLDRHIIDEVGPSGQPKLVSCIISRRGTFALDRIEALILDHNKLLTDRTATAAETERDGLRVRLAEVESRVAGERREAVKQHDLYVAAQAIADLAKADFAKERERNRELERECAEAKEDIATARKKAAAAASLAILAQEEVAKARQDANVECEMRTQFQEKLEDKTKRLNDAYAKVGELTERLKTQTTEPPTPEKEETDGPQEV